MVNSYNPFSYDPFSQALRSMEGFFNHRLTAPDSLGSFNFSTEGEKSPSSLDSFGSGRSPNKLLSSLSGPELPSRGLSRLFGSPSGFKGTGQSEKSPDPSGKSPDNHVDSFLKGGFGIFGGGSGMPGAGMAMPGNFVAPPVAPPRFQQAPVQQASAPTNFNVNVRPRRAEKDPEPDVITGKMRKAAVSKVADMGYGPKEAGEIVAKAQGAADGDKTRFGTIIDRLPPREFPEGKHGEKTEDEIKELKENYEKKWHKEFGRWYSKNILQLKQTEGEALVERVASKPSEAAEIKVEREKHGPPGLLGYRIVDGPGKGEFRYYNNSEKKWYSSFASGKGKDEIKLVSSPPVKGTPKEKLTLKVASPGANDYLGTEYDRVMEKGGRTYVVYKVVDQVGKKAKGVKAKELFSNVADDKWYSTPDGTGSPIGDFHVPDEQRLYFHRVADYEPHADIEDAYDYIGVLDEGMGDLKEARKEQDRIYKDLVAEFKNRVVKELPPGVSKNFGINVKGKNIEIAIDPADAKDFIEAFADKKIDEAKFNDAFRLIPKKGTRFFFNGASSSSLVKDPHDAISRKVKRIPRPVKVKVDLSGATKVGEVEKAILDRIRKAMKNGKISRISEIDIEVKIPDKIFSKEELYVLIQEIADRFHVGPGKIKPLIKGEFKPEETPAA